jgi:hypothetical protein
MTSTVKLVHGNGLQFHKITFKIFTFEVEQNV